MYNLGGLKDGGAVLGAGLAPHSWALHSEVVPGGFCWLSSEQPGVTQTLCRGIWEPIGGTWSDHGCSAPLRSVQHPPCPLVSPACHPMVSAPWLAGAPAFSGRSSSAQTLWPHLPEIPSAPQLQPGHRGWRTLVQGVWVWVRMGVRNRSRGRKCGPK